MRETSSATGTAGRSLRRFSEKIAHSSHDAMIYTAMSSTDARPRVIGNVRRVQPSP